MIIEKYFLMNNFLLILTIMMKYRGPKEQYTRMERKYFIQLIFGLILISLSIPLESYRQSLSDVEIEQPLAPGGEILEPVRIKTNTSSAISYLVIFGGTMVNLYSIRKYNSEYSEIKEKEERPAYIFIGLGILCTVIAIGYCIMVIT